MHVFQQLIKHGAEFVVGELLFLEEFAEDVAGLEVVEAGPVGCQGVAEGSFLRGGRAAVGKAWEAVECRGDRKLETEN